MKVAVCSDLHLEFAPISLENKDNADVLILSGDICVVKDLREKDDAEFDRFDRNKELHQFFQECCERFPNVIYIMGNHEHYHGDFSKSYDTLRSRLGYLHNLHILEKEFVEINGVCFAAGTLWTDMNKEDPVTIQQIKGYMNDYRIIEDSSEMVTYKTPRYKTDAKGDYIMTKTGAVNHYVEEGVEFHTRPAKFSPEKSVVEHKAMMQFIKDSIDSRPEMPWVVVGHHAPSKQSTKPRYQKDVTVNGAYSSDLSEFILDRPQIKLWTHGHTHDTFDYMIGTTRIVCNPRGYIYYEGRADEFELLTVEI